MMYSSRKKRNFSGKFTKDARKQFLEKRLTLGLTYYRLAHFFGLDWTTIRKWELGPTLYCNISNRKRLQDFLDGVYDHEFTLHGNDSYNPQLPHIPPAIRECMEKIINTYIICKEDQNLTRRLQDSLDCTISNTLRRLTSSPEEEYARSRTQDYV